MSESGRLDGMYVSDDDGLEWALLFVSTKGIVDTQNEIVSVRVGGGKKRRRSVEERRKMVEEELFTLLGP